MDVFLSNLVYAILKAEKNTLNLLQAAMTTMSPCHDHRAAACHLPGFDCLSDEQVLHILLYMDVDTLLRFGRCLSLHAPNFPPFCLLINL